MQNPENNTRRILSFSYRLAIVALLILPMSFAVGCKSPGEKKYEEGKELRKRHLNDKAIVAFDQAAALLDKEGANPAKAYYKIASIQKGRHLLEEAIVYYLKAIDEDPDDMKYPEKLIGAYVQSGQVDKAEELYNKVKDHASLKYDIEAKQKLEDRRKEIEAKRLEMAEAATAQAEAETTPAPEASPEAAAETDEAAKAAPAPKTSSQAALQAEDGDEDEEGHGDPEKNRPADYEKPVKE